MRLRFWTVVTSVALASTLAAPGAWGDKPLRVGKNPGQTKGRWLEVSHLDGLKSLSRVAVGQVTVEIDYKDADREGVIDERLLADKIREHLVQRLEKSGLFDQVAARMPEGAGAGWLRLDCDLLVDPGSRAARYFVGMGAGKSKSVFEIFLRDHASGRDLGLYHGYGTGTGMGLKVAGGGARKMTQDDIQESAKKFVELLQEVW